MGEGEDPGAGGEGRRAQQAVYVRHGYRSPGQGAAGTGDGGAGVGSSCHARQSARLRRGREELPGEAVKSLRSRGASLVHCFTVAYVWIRTLPSRTTKVSVARAT